MSRSGPGPAGETPPAGPAGGALVSLSQVEAAAGRIRDAAIRTPLLACPELSEELGREVRLKCESLQRTGSFKIRGAYNFVSGLDEDARGRGVITYSSGNHAQAVALAARLHGVEAVVVMPTTAPAVKREGAERLGAEVVEEGTTSLERKERAEALAAERGLAMVPPFDDPAIIAGQGTVGMEIAETWPGVKTVAIPIGGGGLASGCSVALRALLPKVRLVGVEPVGAASMRAALDAGEPVVLDAIDTIADGLAPVRSGELTFLHVRELMDDVVTVEDDAIREAARWLVGRRKLVVEYSGAAALAAVMGGLVAGDGPTAVVLSGGNLDPSLLQEIA